MGNENMLEHCSAQAHKPIDLATDRQQTATTKALGLINGALLSLSPSFLYSQFFSLDGAGDLTKLVLSLPSNYHH